MDDLARPTLPTVTRLVALGVQRSPSPAPIGIMPNVPQFTTLASLGLGRLELGRQLLVHLGAIRLIRTSLLLSRAD